MAGRHCRTSQFLLGPLMRSRAYYKEEELIEKFSQELLEFVGIGKSSNELSKNLSYGSQRRLEIARALATEPKLLILDEPTAGMNPTEINGLIELVLQIQKRGVTVLLIEHQMRVVMGISDRVFVLDYGVLIAQGTAEQVVKNEKVIEAYLGKGS